MRITKGKVINGHIEIEDETLEEGSSVTVLVADESTFTLTEKEEAALLESIDEANRGELARCSGCPAPAAITDAMLPVEVTPIAAGQIEQAAQRWLANRVKAPNAFREEIERGFALVSQTPEVGAKASNVKLKDVRRIHLSRFRQRDVAVALSLPVNVQHQARTVDGRHLKSGALQQPQSAAVDGRQASTVDRNADQGQHESHFLTAENNGQLEFTRRPDEA